MRGYTDIHTHILSGVDDGAVDDAMMFAMLDMAYSGGTRRICLTPHFNPYFFGDNGEASDAAFRRLCEYAAVKYPDMELYLGNELNYSQSSVEALTGGLCRRLNGSKFVLVDFDFSASIFQIRSALHDLINSGFIPVFAHSERYECIDGEKKTLDDLKKLGIFIQINAASLLGMFGKSIHRRAWKLLSDGLADIVASDAHDTKNRPPGLDVVADMIAAKFNPEYADLLLRKNPNKVIGLF